MIARRLRACALGAVLASGCASARPADVVPPEPPAAPGGLAAVAATPSRTARLAEALDAILASPTFGRASVSVVVRSLDTGETLFRRNGQTWLVPASTMKVLTAVAAAERLGWQYRFETRLVATGPIVNGTIDGDLLVVGTGDPPLFIRTEVQSPRPGP